MANNGHVVVSGGQKSGNDPVIQEYHEGGQQIYGLARKIVSQSAGTYNTTEILGYRVITAGSGNWSLTSVDGAAVTGIVPTGFVVGEVYPEHLSSITVGTGGVALLYIPS